MRRSLLCRSSVCAHERSLPRCSPGAALVETEFAEPPHTQFIRPHGQFGHCGTPRWRCGQKFSGIILDPPPRVPPPPKAAKHRPVGQDFVSLIQLCCQLLEKDAWLLCIYHRYEQSHDQHDKEIIDASGGRLAPMWRAAADDDFPETDPNRRTRMTAFRASIDHAELGGA